MFFLSNYTWAWCLYTSPALNNRSLAHLPWFTKACPGLCAPSACGCTRSKSCPLCKILFSFAWNSFLGCFHRGCVLVFLSKMFNFCEDNFDLFSILTVLTFFVWQLHVFGVWSPIILDSRSCDTVASMRLWFGGFERDRLAPPSSSPLPIWFSVKEVSNCRSIVRWEVERLDSLEGLVVLERFPLLLTII